MRSLRTSPHPIARTAAALEQLALGLWIGALIGFAFFFAPLAFRAITDLGVFAALTASVLDRLAILGYVCGSIAILSAIVRTATAGDRTPDVIRIAIVVLALGGVVYESRVVAPEMSNAMAAFGGSFDRVQKSDPRRIAYDALHRQSTQVYGGVVVLGVLALGLAAFRSIE